MKATVSFLSITLLLTAILSAGTLHLSPDQAIDHALEGNLELRAARYQIAVAEAERKWSGRLDAPELEVSGQTDEWGLNENESVIEVAISQKFPLTNRLKHERNLSDVDLALAQAEVRMREWELAAETRTQSIEALALAQRIQLHQELAKVLSTLVENLEAAYQRAEASQLDVTEAKLEVRMQAQAVEQLKGELALAEGALRKLLGVPEASRVQIAGSLSKPIACYAAPTPEVLASRPDLQLHVLQEQRAEAALALAKSQRWEDIVVRFVMEREASVDAPEGLERNTFLGVGVSIPLPLRNKRITEAPTQELEAAQASTDAMTLAIRHEIALANEEVANWRKIWEQAAGEILELSRSNVEQVREAWSTGKVSILRLQRAQERALTMEEDAIEALYQYHLACARLRRAAAQDLPPPSGDALTNLNP